MESSTVSEVIDRAVQQLGYTATKEHQRTVVEGLVGGKDVFGILPTGSWIRKRGGAGRYHGYGALLYSYASDACEWARDFNGATRNARTKKSIGTGTVC